MRYPRGTPKAERNPKLIAVLLRSVEVLDHLHEAGGDLGISEISRLTELPRPTVYRILATLATTGLVAYNEATQQYALGPKVLEYGLQKLSTVDLRRIAQPHLRKLRDVTRETATVSALIDNMRMYLDQVESPQEVRQTVELGKYVPLYTGGSGKAILAFLPPDRLEAYLQEVQLTALTSKTITEVRRLRKDLEAARAAGYAQSRDERVVGAASVAAPIFGRHGEVVGCLSVSGPSNRFTSQVAQQYGPLVQAAAMAVSRELGCTAPAAANAD